MSFANREAPHDGYADLIAAGTPRAQTTLNRDSSAMGGGTLRNDLLRPPVNEGPVSTYCLTRLSKPASSRETLWASTAAASSRKAPLRFAARS